MEGSIRQTIPRGTGGEGRRHMPLMWAACCWREAERESPAATVHRLQKDAEWANRAKAAEASGNARHSIQPVQLVMLGTSTGLLHTDHSLLPSTTPPTLCNPLSLGSTTVHSTQPSHIPWACTHTSAHVPPNSLAQKEGSKSTGLGSGPYLSQMEGMEEEMNRGVNYHNIW